MYIYYINIQKKKAFVLENSHGQGHQIYIYMYIYENVGATCVTCGFLTHLNSISLSGLQTNSHRGNVGTR